MTLSRSTIQNLYKSGDLRPTGEWVMCAGVGCDEMAAHEVVHQPDDGQRVFVPLCLLCIESSIGGRVEYVMEMHGFFGPGRVE